MEERFGQAAHDFKSAALPESDGALIGADDEVELHGAKGTAPGVVERVHTHRSRDASARGSRRSDVTAIGHMGTASHLIRAEEISACEGGFVFGHEDLMGV